MKNSERTPSKRSRHPLLHAMITGHPWRLRRFGIALIGLGVVSGIVSKFTGTEITAATLTLILGVILLLASRKYNPPEGPKRGFDVIPSEPLRVQPLNEPEGNRNP